MNTNLDIDALNKLLTSESQVTMTDAELGYRHSSGMPKSEAHKAAIGAGNKGVTRANSPWTEERKAAAREVYAKRMAERNARRAAGEVVQVISDEGRKNIGLAARGRKPTHEVLKKRSESMKRTLALKRQAAMEQSK